VSVPDARHDARFLAAAGRLAVRGHGGAEPNPLVGCVLVGPSLEVVGWGFHRRCGGPHAEIEALRRAGPRARGATAYVTLEPCDHTGRTAPCSEALISARVGAVVYARDDPHTEAGGGADRLRAAGIGVRRAECPAAASVSDPFVRRVRTGLPWVIAKWAQTVDGRVATRTGESRWISGERSRRVVHRARGRVDAVLTGIGTVLADDPRLTARGVRRRRVARRIVVDPELRLPADAALLATLDEAPLTVVCDETRRGGDAGVALAARGVEVVGAAAAGDGLPLEPVLRDLAGRHDLTTVLVESGPGLLGRLFAARLVCEAWVFTAPRLIGDGAAVACVDGLRVDALADATRLETIGVHRRGDDVLARYRVT
jgi:diaminohydroxyphosphoribosylaminopyrimidine deaminase/5-amino-6-(5-phosphoribosylamino)uracil reductase